MEKVLLSEMTYLEVEEALRKPHVALIPTGSTEQHGPHLPLDVDTRIATELCQAAARVVAENLCAVVVPPMSFGISEHHMAFPGTLTIEPEVFIGVLCGVGESLIRHGFDRLLIVNGHGGNEGAVQISAQKLRLQSGAKCVVFVSEWDLAADAFASVRESGPGGTGHACEYETSMYLRLQPELVQLERAVREVIPPVIDGGLDDLFVAGPYRVAAGRDSSRSGVEGDPTLASGEKGEEIYASAVRNLARIAEAVALL